jgi:hypothetical protein
MMNVLPLSPAHAKISRSLSTCHLAMKKGTDGPSESSIRLIEWNDARDRAG